MKTAAVECVQLLSERICSGCKLILKKWTGVSSGKDQEIPVVCLLTHIEKRLCFAFMLFLSKNKQYKYEACETMCCSTSTALSLRSRYTAQVMCL
jgi:hypothetical protein